MKTPPTVCVLSALKKRPANALNEIYFRLKFHECAGTLAVPQRLSYQGIRQRIT